MSSNKNDNSTEERQHFGSGLTLPKTNRYGFPLKSLGERFIRITAMREKGLCPLALLLFCVSFIRASKDVKKFVRRCCAGKQEACAQLVQIARTHEDSDVRAAAVEMIADNAVLADIATMDKSARVRNIAVEKLTDQTALAKVALTDENFLIRERAIDKLTDQMTN